jgi:S-DNA-T family DNA segregation ATPase FtsK/SpoIIIE
MVEVLALVGGCAAVTVWLLHKIGKTLVVVAEAVATVAVVFVALWWLVKGLVWMVRQVGRRPRTSLAVVAVVAWWHWLGWLSLSVTLAGVLVMLAGWRLVDVMSFEWWVWRWVRAWWLRWTVYAPKLPAWLHACGLSTRSSRSSGTSTCDGTRSGTPGSRGWPMPGCPCTIFSASLVTAR